MKILHVFKDYYPVVGGIENNIKILSEYQAQNGFDVTVLTTSLNRKTSIEEINSVKVIRASRIAEVSSTPISIALFKWMAALDADITHLHFPYPIGEFAHLMFGKSPHTVITYHNDIVKQKYLIKLYKPFLLRTFQKADCIITTTQKLIETSPVLNKFTHKCKVVPYGIDINRFSQLDKEASSKIRDKYNNAPLVLFVGRLRYFKGLDYLLKAMRDVNAVLLIIGSGSEEKKLKTMVSEDGLQDKVVFLGEIPNENTPEYFNACDIFVLPSSHRSESFGIVLIEAMASGKALISTELGTGTSFVNVHGKTGLVVPPRDPESLSGAINKLLEDESLRKEFARNARERAESYSMEAMNKRMVKLYEDLVVH